MYTYSTNLIPYVPTLTFHQLKNSESLITCYRNPSIETLAVLKEVYGVNTLLTTIMHIDQLYYTKTKCQEWGIEYMNILFTDTPKPVLRERDFNKTSLAKQIVELYEKLKNEKCTLLIQSAGGSFKTGIITYCLLRLSGEQRDDALKILLMLRNETKNGFGDQRIEFAEKQIIPLIIGKELI